MTHREVAALPLGAAPRKVGDAAVGVTMAAAALASYVPARRAAAIDPIETLKTE